MPLHLARQPERDHREYDQDDQPDYIGHDKGQHAFEDRRKAHVFDDAFYDEDVHADRRVNESEFDCHDDDDAEPDRIEAEFGDHGKDDRHRQDDHGHRVHQASENDVHDHDQREHAVPPESE